MLTGDKARYDKLQRIGCLACRHYGYYQSADMHHLLSGTHRIGNDATIPLCEYHHRGIWHLRFPSLKKAYTLLGPSLALEPKRFHERFGSDEELLAQAQRLINVP